MTHLLGDRGVDDVHAPHGSCGIVEYPVLLHSPVRVKSGIGVSLYQLLEQCVDDERRVAAGCSGRVPKGKLDSLVQCFGSEVIEAVLSCELYHPDDNLTASLR